MQKEGKLKVFCIVVTYNGMKWADKCTDSILYSRQEITPVFIDNGSTDGTVEYLKKKFPSAALFLPEKNLGFGSANNLGIRYALENRADYVLLCNQDVWFGPDTVSGLIDVMKGEKNFAIISPVHLNHNQNVDSLFSSYMSKVKKPTDSHWLQKETSLFRLPFVNAAFWLMDVAWIRKVGGFNPIFFMYGEDDNYCSRVKFFNGLVGVCPLISIIHDRGERAPTASHGRLIFRMRLRNKLFNINNKNPLWSGIKFTLLHALSKKSLACLFLSIKEFFLFMKNRDARLMQFNKGAFIL